MGEDLRRTAAWHQGVTVKPGPVVGVQLLRRGSVHNWESVADSVADAVNFLVMPLPASS